MEKFLTEENIQLLESKQNELNQYNFEGESFFITSPITVEQIVKEGETLRHAVAYYIPKMKQNMLILFLRKKRAPEKPFYTIAIVDNQVVMVKGLHNKEIHQEDNKEFANRLGQFINDWQIAKNLQ